MMSGDVVTPLIRTLQTIEEYKASEQLQRDVWGDDDPADNADILQAIAHEGGLVAGAFDNQRMIGFLFAFPTRHPGIQHSHRLAVHPDAQGTGLGTRLKWFQRQWCIDQGIGTVRWTFDPVRAANANLNIAKLGATADIYHENYYGDMAGINAGVPSDRIVAQWDLNAAQVVNRAQTETDDPTKLDSRFRGNDKRRGSGENQTKSSAIPVTAKLPELHIAIPGKFDKLLNQDRHKALEERMRVRAELIDAFANGYQIIGFNPIDSYYLLTQPIQSL